MKTKLSTLINYTWQTYELSNGKKLHNLKIGLMIFGAVDVDYTKHTIKIRLVSFENTVCFNWNSFCLRSAKKHVENRVAEIVKNILDKKL